MKDTIAKYNIECLWHFTDRKNLASIAKHDGLWSFAELNRRGIEIPEPGGNEWSHEADTQKRLGRYVHLSFCKNSPMLWTAQTHENRIPNPAWLEIDANLLLEDNVRFSVGVANKGGMAILNAEQAKAQVDFEILFGPRDRNSETQETRDRWNAATKSEILVPNFIPIASILNWKETINN